MNTTNKYDSIILDLIPDGVVAVDEECRLLRLNHAACRLLDVPDASAFLGQPVSLLMDELGFRRLLEGEGTAYCETVQPSEESHPLERSFSCDESRAVLVCVLREVTPVQQDDLQPSQQRAAALADAICEKQLAIVHEIAGLLGEAAVETQSMARELKQALHPGKEERHG